MNDDIRLKTVNLQAIVLQQYRNTDNYKKAQEALTQQAQNEAQEIESLIAELQKSVDPTGKQWVYDRQALGLVAPKAPAPTPTK